MRFAWRNAMLCAGLALAGCGFAKKPYADDPLLRDRRAAWPSRDATPKPPPPAPEAPQPPATLPPVTSPAE